jgi:hypothetical protein
LKQCMDRVYAGLRTSGRSPRERGSRITPTTLRFKVSMLVYDYRLLSAFCLPSCRSSRRMRRKVLKSFNIRRLVVMWSLSFARVSETSWRACFWRSERLLSARAMSASTSALDSPIASINSPTNCCALSMLSNGVSGLKPKRHPPGPFPCLIRPTAFRPDHGRFGFVELADIYNFFIKKCRIGQSKNSFCLSHYIHLINLSIIGRNRARNSMYENHIETFCIV